jgi:hypothetical protein
MMSRMQCNLIGNIANVELIFKNCSTSAWITLVDRIAIGVKVLMQCLRIPKLSVIRIAAEKSSRVWIVVSGAEVVEG